MKMSGNNHTREIDVWFNEKEYRLFKLLIEACYKHYAVDIFKEWLGKCEENRKQIVRNRKTLGMVIEEAYPYWGRATVRLLDGGSRIFETLPWACQQHPQEAANFEALRTEFYNEMRRTTLVM